MIARCLRCRRIIWPWTHVSYRHLHGFSHRVCPKPWLP